MTDTSGESTEEARERLEHQADATRARLLDDLDTLDDRRHRAQRFLQDAGKNVKRHKTLLIGVGVGVLVAVGLFALARRRSARKKAGYQHAEAVKNLLGPGYVVESVQRRDRHIMGTLGKAALGVAFRLAKEKWLRTHSATG